MKELTQSLENYLLSIYEIVKDDTATRVKEVALKMSIGMASTSVAVKTLASRGYVKYKPYGVITITKKGINTVETKLKRHEIICNFLEKVLKMDSDKIESSAENIEFSMTEDVLSRFVQYLTFMQKCSCKEPKWVKSFQYYLTEGKMQDKCNLCIKNKDTFDNSSCCGCSTK